MRFGVVANSQSLADTVNLSKIAERYEFDFIWVPDENPTFPYRDYIVSLTAIASNTKSINMGCGVTNPYSRHIALTALQFASLAELCSGRTVVLGLSCGGPMPLMPLGIKMWEKPMTTLRESVQIARKLFRGEVVNYESKGIKLRNLRLFGPVDVPIYLAARGPMMLKLAGEISDGVILNPPLELIPYAIENVKMGLKTADKTEFEYVLYTPIVLSRNFKIMRPMATMLFWSLPSFILEKMGPQMLRLAQEVGELVKAVGYTEESMKHITDDIVRKFVVAGTPDECIDAIQKQRDIGVTQVAFMIIPYRVVAPPHYLEDTIKKIGEDVIPSLK